MVSAQTSAKNMRGAASTGASGFVAGDLRVTRLNREDNMSNDQTCMMTLFPRL